MACGPVRERAAKAALFYGSICSCFNSVQDSGIIAGRVAGSNDDLRTIGFPHGALVCHGTLVCVDVVVHHVGVRINVIELLVGPTARAVFFLDPACAHEIHRIGGINVELHQNFTIANSRCVYIIVVKIKTGTVFNSSGKARTHGNDEAECKGKGNELFHNIKLPFVNRINHGFDFFLRKGTIGNAEGASGKPCGILYICI